MACPNCGSPLFSGLAPGNILVCRDAEGNGCQIAVDPANPEGETLAVRSTEVAQPSPEVGPPNEGGTEAVPPSPDVQEAISEAWQPPTSAPQAMNADEEQTPAPAAPAAPSTTPPTPPSSATTGDGTAQDKPQS